MNGLHNSVYRRIKVDYNIKVKYKMDICGLRMN